MALKHNPAGSGMQAYSIQIDINKRPIALIGRVRVTVTKGRPLPPSPYSEFVTDYTPFDRGHIMALELGGPDISENIVPQYRQWQETGAWRRVEDKLCKEASANNAILVVALSYPAHPNAYAAQQLRFSQNEIFDWKDPCIPDDFTIWFLPASDALAQRIEKELLTVAAVEKNFTDLLAEAGKKKPYEVLKHNCMPPEDRRYWENQQIGLAVKNAYGSYLQKRRSDIEEMETELTANPIPGLGKSQQREAIDVTRSPLRDDVEFVTTQKPLIAMELQTSWGWTPLQTTSLDGGRVTQAYLGERTKSQKKTHQKRHDDYVKKADASRYKRDGYVMKKVPYQGKGHTSNTPY